MSHSLQTKREKYYREEKRHTCTCTHVRAHAQTHTPVDPAHCLETPPLRWARCRHSAEATTNTHAVFSLCLTFDPSLVLLHLLPARCFLCVWAESRLPRRSSGPFYGPGPASSRGAPGPTARSRSPPNRPQHLQPGEQSLNIPNRLTGSGNRPFFFISLIVFVGGHLSCRRPEAAAWCRPAA